METILQREIFLANLYEKAFPAVAAYVSRRGGSFDDAKDVFQEALIIFYEKTRTSEVAPENEKAYLLGIAKHRWIRRFNEDRRFDPLEADAEGLPGENELHFSERKVLRFLETAGRKCMELLRAFYYDQLPVKELAKTFGYSGERSATVQKYKCLEKVREQVKEKSLTYADFLESD